LTAPRLVKPRISLSVVLTDQRCWLCCSTERLLTRIVVLTSPRRPTKTNPLFQIPSIHIRITQPSMGWMQQRHHSNWIPMDPILHHLLRSHTINNKAIWHR